jgi:hypothetical protein
MSVIELLWHLNVTDTTKYLIIFGIIVCILMMCVMNGQKKNKNKKKNKSFGHNNQDKEYVKYFMKSSPTKCQTNYMKCMENNINSGGNDFCYPCLDNGNSPDFFYNPQINQWVKLT